MTDFVHLPDFPDYRINRDGIILGKLGRPLKKRFMGASRAGNKKYQQYALYHNGKRYEKMLHHLMLEAFVGPRPDGMVGCHRDDDIENNKISNLYWGTPEQNAADKVRNRTHCKCGLELSGENVIVRDNGKKNGAKTCVACYKAKRREYYINNRSKILARVKENNQKRKGGVNAS